MKKAILMFAAAGLLVATPSCKKGENDPFLSLSSRKARVAGTWSLASGTVTYTNTYSWGGDNYTDVDTYTYDGANVTYVNALTGPGGTVTSTPNTVTHTETHTFEKDGSYTSTVMEDGNTDTGTGYWSFVGKSKAGELKKKEALIITFTQTVNSGNTNTYTGKSMSPDNMLLLDRLKGKEMDVKVDWMSTYSSGDTYKAEGMMSYVQ